MVNHLRTLLLNRDGSSTPGPTYPGEEFVPPEYHARTLTGTTKNVYDLLFGREVDRATYNWRLREFMALIHSTELVEFASDLDPRFTYLPFSNRLFDTVAAGPIITNNVGTKTLYPLISPGVPLKQLYYKWRIEVTGASDVDVTILANPFGLPSPVTHTYAVSSGLSSIVPLDGSPYNFRFEEGVGSIWTLELTVAPSRKLIDVYESLRSGLTPRVVDSLFGERPSEPFRTFKNLWVLNPHPPYQLGGVILAVGYRISEIRP